MEHTFTIITENTPGVLHRISAIFTRRRINIESLTAYSLSAIKKNNLNQNKISVNETLNTDEDNNLSQFTIVVNLDKPSIDKIIGQINKVIEVIQVSVSAEI